MLNLGQLAKRAEKLITHNSPVILTAIGVTGAVATAYLTGRASFKAAQILSEESPHLDTKEKVELVWRLYIPAVTTGLMTITCIILANRIEHRRAAALTAAFALSEKAFEEYKAKIVEKIGPKKEQNYRDEIAQDQVNQNPPPNNLVILSPGKILCYDAFAGRYFESDMESLKKAQNDINRQIMHDGFASLSDFYDLLGLRHTDLSNDVGWNSEQEVELRFSSVLSEDSRPCLSFTFSVHPFRGHSLYH